MSAYVHYAKVIQIAATGHYLFALGDDGVISAFDIRSSTWAPLSVPEGCAKRDRLVGVKVQHRNMPQGYDLWRDGESGLWQWRRDHEESAVFGSIDDAVSDAKQKHLIATLPKESTNRLQVRG